MNPRSLAVWLIGLSAPLVILSAAPAGQTPQAPTSPAVTFHRDIAPILQRSCQGCHRPNALAPMSLITYEEVRPYARAIKNRTGLRHRQGVMPPWYIEKDLGIPPYKNDVSLSAEEIAIIAQWADTGAPQGNRADAPPPLNFADANAWAIGEPDLVVVMPPVKMKAIAPDWWGDAGSAPTGLTEDRYVAAVQIREVSDSQGRAGGSTIGGLFVFHHAIMAVTSPDGRQDFGAWPVHEVGRNADVFNPQAGKLLRAGSTIGFPNVHLHANGKDTSAHLEVGLKLHPKGYTPAIRERLLTIGTGAIDVRPMEAGQKIESFTTLQSHTKLTVFEPHMHAAGVRMCLDASWGSKIETLSCAGYDHNWVRSYQYEDDVTPLLPKGTILRLTGYYDNTPSNKNVVDPRNWSGLGHRSIDNMLVMIGQGVYLTEQQFAEEVTRRRTTLKVTEGQTVVGCPRCWVPQQ
jgi:mono/diheme cytochrome c family protein